MILFTLPLIVSQLLHSAYNLVDMYIVGQFVGQTGIIGVSQAGDITMFLNSISMALASAGQILIAQQIGGMQYEESKKTIGNMITMLMAFAAVSMLLIFTMGRIFVGWLNVPDTSVDNCLIYLTICAIGFPVQFGYAGISSLLRGMGVSKGPLYSIIVSTFVNIALDVLFVGPLHMGAAGAALATIIAQAASFAVGVIVLTQRLKSMGISMEKSNLLPQKETVVPLTKLALPLVIHSAAIHLTQMFLVSQINNYGDTAAAVNSVGKKITNALNIVVQSLKTATSAMVGQNLGAHQVDRAKKSFAISYAINGCIFAINTVLALTCWDFLFGMFDKTPEVLELGRTFMKIQIITFFLSACMTPASGVVNATGFTTLSMITGLLDGIVLRIGLSVLFGEILGWGVSGYFLGNAVARLAPAAIDLVYVISGAWLKRKLLIKERPVERAEASKIEA